MLDTFQQGRSSNRKHTYFFVWFKTKVVQKKRQRQNLIHSILKTTFNNEKKLLCLYLKLEFKKWCSICDGMGGMLAWVTCVSWVAHYFSNSFLKLGSKRIQVSGRMYFNIYFQSFPWILEFKFIVKLFPEQRFKTLHTQNPRYMRNPVHISCEALAY